VGAATPLFLELRTCRIWHYWAAPPCEAGSCPPVGPEEVETLKRVLDAGDANAWTSGPAGTVPRELEGAFADYCGAKHAVAVNSGGTS
jgi:dTDP-4-amino-4,6-dideoxygalactose transaminase